MKKKFVLPMALALLALAACEPGADVGSSSGGAIIESSSSEASSEVTPGSESSEVSSEDPGFTEDDYSLPLLGKFYSPQGEMIVEPNLLKFGDLELKPTSIRNRVIYEGGGRDI